MYSTGRLLLHTKSAHPLHVAISPSNLGIMSKCVILPQVLVGEEWSWFQLMPVSTNRESFWVDLAPCGNNGLHVTEQLT